MKPRLPVISEWNVARLGQVLGDRAVLLLHEFNLSAPPTDALLLHTRRFYDPPLHPT